MNEGENKTILIIEPFYGGSHKKLIDVLISGLPDNCYDVITMTAKKWHWRARTSSLYIFQKIPKNNSYKVLFCSSVLPLAELIGLRPEISKLKKVIYFHENQLAYPVRAVKERDFQYGFNEIMSCLAADVVLFNSFYNKNSFLQSVDKHLKLQPDYRTKGLMEILNEKSNVVYYPLNINYLDNVKALGDKTDTERSLHIVWPHRWEFDKSPEIFLKILVRLHDKELDFEVSILGQSFHEKPDLFDCFTSQLGSKIRHCGFVENEDDYIRILKTADVVVSTALHEFFGLSVLESVHCGCMPLLPKRLVYPEMYPAECLYSDDEELCTKLKNYCLNRTSLKDLRENVRSISLRYNSDDWLRKVKTIMEVS